MRFERDRAAGRVRDLCSVRIRRRELEVPAGTESPSRQRKDGRLVARVEQNCEGIAPDRLAAARRVVKLVSVQEDTERAPAAVLPVVSRHAATVRTEPPGIGEPRTRDAATLEKASASENRMSMPERDQASRELDEVTTFVVEL